MQLVTNRQVLAIALLTGSKLAAYVNHLHNHVDSICAHRNKAEELDTTENFT